MQIKETRKTKKMRKRKKKNLVENLGKTKKKFSSALFGVLCNRKQLDASLCGALLKNP